MRTGVHERQELPLEDNPAYCQLKFSQADTLAVIAAEYKLFTHGLMFTHGGWDRDPLNDYVVEWNPEFAPLVLDLHRRVFFGMGCKDENGRRRSEWCYKLLAIRHEGWKELFAYMSMVGAIQRDTGYLAKLLAQVIPVPDVLALERKSTMPTVCPTVDVVVFGVDSNKRAVYVEPAKQPPLDKPKVKLCPPDPETIELAKRILSGDSTPYEGADIKFEAIRRAKAANIIAAALPPKLLV
jgi:hypothetical protein